MMKAYLYLVPLLCTLASPTTLSADYFAEDEVQQAYHSNEIDVAVEGARRFPNQADYVGYEWYNRTTSKSFPLPKLLNAEMNDMVIEGAMGPTAAGVAAAEESSRPVKNAAQGLLTEDESLIEADESIIPVAPSDVTRSDPVYIREISSSTDTGRIIVRDTRSSGSVTATGR